MKHAPEMRHPFTDQFAATLHARCPEVDLPAITGIPDASFEPWEQASPEIRAVFRARARRFMAGDMSMLPWATMLHAGGRGG